MKASLFAAALLAIPLVSARGQTPFPPVSPDPVATPGEVVPGITMADLCPTEHIKRPPITAAMKRQIYANYPGMLAYCRDHPCEIDHRIPFSLGGATTVKNLWPQAKDVHPGGTDKDRLETLSHKDYCMGTWSLDQARSLFDDWLSSYDRIYGASW